MSTNGFGSKHESKAAAFLIGAFMGVLSTLAVLGVGQTDSAVSAPVVETPEPVSATYSARVLRAVDSTQSAAWVVANYCPTDGVMRWYEEVLSDLQNIECELRPQECE